MISQYTNPNVVEIKIGKATLEMIKVQGGSYQMGRDKHHPYIRLSDFWIGKYPVHQALYEEVMGENPSYFKHYRKPVEQVSWYDCKHFLSKLNVRQEVQAVGAFFRLPTEAEWEYAASDRGTGNYTYAGGDELIAVGWYDENSRNQSQEIGLKKPTNLGIHDLCGNVWEWCEDDFDSEAFSKMPSEMLNPVCIDGQIIALERCLKENMHLESNTNRISRGGSWRDGIRCCMLTNRDTYTAGLRLNIIGFRLVGTFNAL